MNNHNFDIYFDDGDHMVLLIANYELKIHNEMIEIQQYGSRMQFPGMIKNTIDLRIIAKTDAWAKSFQKFPSSVGTGFIMVDRSRQILYDICFLEKIEYSHDPSNQAFFIDMTVGFNEMITGDIT